MLTELQEKLAEAHAHAIAAATAAALVERFTPDPELRRELASLRSDADETRARCLGLERSYGKQLADELLAHANTAKERVGDLADAWFKAGTSALSAWTFLAMGEAAEVAVWLTVETLAAKAEEDAVVRLAAWALPIQRRHLDTALSGVARLAELRDPTGPRWG